MSALHPNGQMVTVHYEENSEHHVRTGRLYGNYDGTGPVTITVARDCHVTFAESRVVYIEEIRTRGEES